MRSSLKLPFSSPCRWPLKSTHSIAASLILATGIISLDAATPAMAQQAKVEILITSDKRANGSDGWVKLNNGTKHWVSGDCRYDLLSAGAVLKVLPWQSIANRPDSTARQSCAELINSMLTPPVADTNPTPSSVQVLTTASNSRDGSPGWVEFDGKRKWINSRCRSQLIQAGASLEVVNWPRIKTLPRTAERKSCDQLQTILFSSQPNDVPVSTPPVSNPIVDVPVVDEPIVEVPVIEEPIVEVPVVEVPVIDEPIVSNPTVEQPVIEVPPVDEPVVANPPSGNPMVKPPVVEEPVVVSPPVSNPGVRPENVRQNLALIENNITRNTLFDDNQFKDVPISDISVSDLTVNADIYNEGFIDTTNSGYFRVKCEVSHFAYDDPIVFPNQPGRAHLHMFFGNTQANAYSTFNSLLNSGTGTCNGEDLNRTAYWVPAMLDSQGNALIPDEVMVYYKNDNFRLNGANELVEPFPDNLRMIAGNGKARSPQTGFTGDFRVQPTISFSCGQRYRSNDKRQALIPDCYGNGNHIEMQIAFPQCVNEAAGTYRPDQAHTSYSEGGYYGSTCPASHPTDISSIMYRIFFSVREYGGALTDLYLSSDFKMDGTLPGGTTAHADWFGAWHPQTMDMWVDNCNNVRTDCETGVLSRNPDVSLKLRKRGFYPPGYRAPAEELVKLCPGKTHNPSNPLSVGMCRMN